MSLCGQTRPPASQPPAFTLITPAGPAPNSDYPRWSDRHTADVCSLRSLKSCSHLLDFGRVEIAPFGSFHDNHHDHCNLSVPCHEVDRFRHASCSSTEAGQDSRLQYTKGRCELPLACSLSGACILHASALQWLILECAVIPSNLIFFSRAHDDCAETKPKPSPQYTDLPVRAVLQMDPPQIQITTCHLTLASWSTFFGTLTRCLSVRQSGGSACASQSVLLSIPCRTAIKLQSITFESAGQLRNPAFASLWLIFRLLEPRTGWKNYYSGERRAMSALPFTPDGR